MKKTTKVNLGGRLYKLAERTTRQIFEFNEFVDADDDKATPIYMRNIYTNALILQAAAASYADMLPRLFFFYQIFYKKRLTAVRIINKYSPQEIYDALKIYLLDCEGTDIEAPKVEVKKKAKSESVTA